MADFMEEVVIEAISDVKKNLPIVLTPNDVMEILPFGKSKIYELLRQKVIPCKKVNGKILIPREPFLAWLYTCDELNDKVIREKSSCEGPITVKVMLGLEKLEVRKRGISDLNGLEYAENLCTLNLKRNPVKDLTPLLNLKKLKKLYLYGDKIEDYSVIAKLHGLTNLNLSRCRTKFFLPTDNETKIPYTKIIKKLWVVKRMTDLQRKALEDFLFNPNKTTARDALGVTPRALIFVRNVLSEGEIRKFFKKVLSSNDVYVRYVKQFLKYKPYGDNTRKFVINNGNTKTKNILLKMDLKY